MMADRCDSHSSFLCKGAWESAPKSRKVLVSFHGNIVSRHRFSGAPKIQNNTIIPGVVYGDELRNPLFQYSNWKLAASLLLDL